MHGGEKNFFFEIATMEEAGILLGLLRIHPVSLCFPHKDHFMNLKFLLE